MPCPFATGSVYALTKGAVASFTRGLARDLGPRGITVNNVQPGPVDTDMNPAEGEFADKLRGYIAVQCYGHGDEIAGPVAYLASPEAGYVTGACLRSTAASPRKQTVVPCHRHRLAKALDRIALTQVFQLKLGVVMGTLPCLGFG